MVFDVCDCFGCLSLCFSVFLIVFILDVFSLVLSSFVSGTLTDSNKGFLEL